VRRYALWLRYDDVVLQNVSQWRALRDDGALQNKQQRRAGNISKARRGSGIKYQHGDVELFSYAFGIER